MKNVFIIALAVFTLWCSNAFAQYYSPELPYSQEWQEIHHRRNLSLEPGDACQVTTRDGQPADVNTDYNHWFAHTIGAQWKTSGPINIVHYTCYFQMPSGVNVTTLAKRVALLVTNVCDYRVQGLYGCAGLVTASLCFVDPQQNGREVCGSKVAYPGPEGPIDAEQHFFLVDAPQLSTPMGEDAKAFVTGKLVEHSWVEQEILLGKYWTIPSLKRRPGLNIGRIFTWSYQIHLAGYGD